MIKLYKFQHHKQGEEKSRCKHPKLREYPFNTRLNNLAFPGIKRLVDQVHGRVFHGVFHGAAE